MMQYLLFVTDSQNKSVLFLLQKRWILWAWGASIEITYGNYMDYLIWWFPIVDLSLHWDSWGSSIKYLGSTQNYLPPITHKQMDKQKGWTRSWSNIWGCSWTTAKQTGQSGWQLLNSHIIMKSKNQLKNHLPTLCNYGFNPQMGFEPQRDEFVD